MTGGSDRVLRAVSRPSIVREPSAADLVRLQRAAGYPMVSLLLATTPAASMAVQDRARLARLTEVAGTRLARELRPSEVDETLRPLREALLDIVDDRTGRGLVVFVGAGRVEAFRLPDPIAERVVVDPSFATRDLARTFARHPGYRLLVLGGGQARLFVGGGRQLLEQTSGAFPLADSSPRELADRRGHLHEPERSHRDQRRWDAFLRSVDDALLSMPESVSLPLVVAAAEPLAGRFRRISTDPVVGLLPGNHVRAGAARLAELARPAVESYLAAQVVERLAELRTAVNRRRAVFGMGEVWRTALGGEVRLLLVEDDFVYPARPAPDGRSLVRAVDVDHPDVLDDAVDEVIELVGRAGGDTVFVPRGELPGSRIAAITTRRTAAPGSTPDEPEVVVAVS